MKNFWRCFTACTAFVLVTSAVFARPVQNAAIGFSIDLPEASAELPRENANVLYSLKVPTGNEGALVLGVGRMHGTLARDSHIKVDLLPKGSRLEDYVWRGFHVEGARVPIDANGTQLISHRVQIPLRPEAIQIEVTGRLEDDLAAKDLLSQLVASVDGKSDWLSDEERSERPGQGIGGLVVILAAATYAVVARRRRKAKTIATASEGH